MNKLLVAGIILIILIAGGLYSYYYFSTGIVKIYLQDAPSSSHFLKIYLTISSIMIHRTNSTNSSGWITISNKTITVLLSSNITFLTSARIPAGEYNEIFLQISAAQVTIGNVNVSAKLPSEVLKIHIINGMDLKGGSTESLLISFPHITYANGQVIISPSITAQVIS